MTLDLGRSLADGTPALTKALTAFPASLLLAAMAMRRPIAIPPGVWLGAATARRAGGAMAAVRAAGRSGIRVGLPARAVVCDRAHLAAGARLGWAKRGSCRRLSVASFLTPKLARMVEANVSAALDSAYVRTARAIGASDREVLWRHALPNALLGATALVGAQLAFLVTGLVIIETMFAWPGIGWLLVQSTTNLDFPSCRRSR